MPVCAAHPVEKLADRKDAARADEPVHLDPERDERREVAEAEKRAGRARVAAKYVGFATDGPHRRRVTALAAGRWLATSAVRELRAAPQIPGRADTPRRALPAPDASASVARTAAAPSSTRPSGSTSWNARAKRLGRNLRESGRRPPARARSPRAAPSAPSTARSRGGRTRSRRRRWREAARAGCATRRVCHPSPVYSAVGQVHSERKTMTLRCDGALPDRQLGRVRAATPPRRRRSRRRLRAVAGARRRRRRPRPADARAGRPGHPADRRPHLATSPATTSPFRAATIPRTGSRRT